MRLNQWYFVFIVLLTASSCNVVEKEPVKNDLSTRNASSVAKPILTKDSISIDLDTSLSQEYGFDTSTVTLNEIVDEFSFVDHRETRSGIVIDWIEKTKGRSLKRGELLMLEYRLSLPDGKIIDGNNRMKMPYLPFVLGFNIQNKGWDEALSLMHIGELAQIKIPANLAYGKKGLGDLIPPNTENWLFVKIHGVVSPSKQENGVKTWELRSGTEHEIEKVSKVKFHMIASTESKANIFNTYTSNFPVTYTPGQRNYPIGLRSVLNNAKIGQQIFVVLDPNMAYGLDGYMDLVKPNESVFYNLKILEIE